MDGTPSRTTKVLAATKSKPPTSPPTWILWIVIPGCHSLRLIADLLLELPSTTSRELLASGPGENVSSPTPFAAAIKELVASS
jgi:hypothetical protein